MDRKKFIKLLTAGVIVGSYAGHSDRLFAATTNNIKAVIVGNTGVGKSSLIATYATDTFPKDAPTVHDLHTVNLKVDGKAVSLGLWDTAGGDDYDMLRPFSYPKTDVFLVCYALNDIRSFQMIEKKWVPELAAHDPKIPFLLVGCKSDLRPGKKGGDSSSFVTPEQGKELQKKVGARDSLECSAKTKDGVKDVFEKALRTVLG